MPLAVSSEQLEVSQHSLVDWHNFCRDVTSRWCHDNGQEMGGLNEDLTARIVEIDESCFFRRKNHVGQAGPHPIGYLVEWRG